MNENSEEEVIETVEEVLELDDVVEGSDTEAELERLRKENLTLKAQKEHFKRKANKKEDTVNTPSENSFTREEAVLIAQGMDLDDLDNLKAIQKGLGLKSFKDAIESPLFKAYSNEKKAEKRRKDASLGASNGSGGSTDNKFKPGMSDEDHRKAWEDARKK